MNTVPMVGRRAIAAVRTVAQEAWDSDPLHESAVREGPAPVGASTGSE